MTIHIRILMSLLVASALAGCTTAAAATDEDIGLARMLSGQSVMQGAELDAAIADAAEHPLGSDENPVRASMPEGQRAYLDRLRCADGSVPGYRRVGSLDIGIYGNIVDGYQVDCPGLEPTMVVMDMYHSGYIENRPVPGFNIVK